MNDNSRARSIQNELLFRRRNYSIKDSIMRYFRHNHQIREVPIEFVCECSRADCHEKVPMSIKQYEQVHKRRDRFVVAKGHVTPQVEKIVPHEDADTFMVVEKYSLPA